MGDRGEVWIFNSRYDWEDVIGMEIGMKIMFSYFSDEPTDKETLNCDLIHWWVIRFLQKIDIRILAQIP